MAKQFDAQTMPPGGIILEAGNATEYKTGAWRTYRPVWFKDRCVQCMTCFMMCPDSSIVIEDGKMAGMDYEHCKGCGICAFECPPKAHAIEMKLDSECDPEGRDTRDTERTQSREDEK